MQRETVFVPRYRPDRSASSHHHLKSPGRAAVVDKSQITSTNLVFFSECRGFDTHTYIVPARYPPISTGRLLMVQSDLACTAAPLLHATCGRRHRLQMARNSETNVPAKPEEPTFFVRWADNKEFTCCMDAPNLLESRLYGIVASSRALGSGCKPAAKIRGPDDGSSTWYLASREDSERLRGQTPRTQRTARPTSHHLSSISGDTYPPKVSPKEDCALSLACLSWVV